MTGKEIFVVLLMWITHKLWGYERRTSRTPYDPDRRQRKGRLTMKQAKQIQQRAVDRLNQTVVMHRDEAQ